MNETAAMGNAEGARRLSAMTLHGALFFTSSRAKRRRRTGLRRLAKRRLFEAPDASEPAKEGEVWLQTEGPGLLMSGVHMRIPKAWADPGSEMLPDQEDLSPAPAAPSPHDDSRQHARAVAAAQLLTRKDFEAAITPVVPRLYRVCLALTGIPDQAEDLLQASLLKAYERRASYAGRGNVAAWLAGVIRHEHDETTRRTLRRKSLIDRAMQEIYNLFDSIVGAPAPDPESWTSSHEQAALLLQCLHEIPEPYRTVVWLCDIEEMTYEEVADMLSVPIGTVKSRHARGRKQLRRTLERRGGMS